MGLRPLAASDQEQVTTFALTQDIWTYFSLKMSDLTSITNYIEDALQQRISGYTFIIEDPITKNIEAKTDVLNLRARKALTKTGMIKDKNSTKSYFDARWQTSRYNIL